MRLEFTVPGNPVPQGSPRAFSAKDRRTGKMRAHIALDSAKLKRWRGVVAHAAQKAMTKRLPFDHPVKVTVQFVFPRPKSIKKHVRFKRSKPDLDKLCRALGDSLTQAAVVTDDSRIAVWVASKFYGPEACMTVAVEELRE
jgi:crossover junction endodeoxyribonuclease RusA